MLTFVNGSNNLMINILYDVGVNLFYDWNYIRTKLFCFYLKFDVWDFL